MYIILITTDNNIYGIYSGHLSGQGLQNDTIHNKILCDKVNADNMLKDLRKIRVEKRLTSRDLAKLSSVSKSSILMIETAKQIPRICIVCRLARGLEMPPEELFSVLIRGENF